VPAYIDSSTAFFRIRYGPEERRELARAFADLPAAQKMALLADTFALAQAGRVPLADYFALASRVQPAADPATQLLYAQVAEALGALDYALVGTPAQARLHAFGREALRPMLARLGWNASPAEGAVTLDLRNKLIATLGRFHDDETLRLSVQVFDASRKGGVPLQPTIRPAIVANVARRADRETFEELVRRMKAAQGVEDRTLYARALGNVEDRALAQQLLELSVGDSLPPDTAASLPRYVALGGAHGALAYAFTRDHFAALARKESEWGRAYLLPTAAEYSNDAAQATALLADVRRLVGPPGDRLARQAAGDIELRSRIKARDGTTLAVDAHN
jgi:aminopeptidase N